MQVENHPPIDCANDLRGSGRLTDKVCQWCRTKQEIERGQYLTVMEGFRTEFDPDYQTPSSRITAQERARRDEYRNRMQKQVEKMNEAFARNTDPDTSHDAAAGIDVTRLQNLVLSALAAAYPHGLTTQEIAWKIRLPRDTVSPRMKPLENRKLVERSGKRKPTGFRKEQIVWRLRK